MSKGLKLFFLHILLSISIPSFAQQTVTDSLLQIAQSGSEAEKQKAYQRLAQISRNNNSTIAIQYINLAIEKSKLLNDEKALALAIQTLASIQYRMGNFSVARDNFTDALLLFTNQQNTKATADVNAVLGSIYFALGNLPLASDHYLKAVRFYEELNDNAGLVNMFSSLGSIYARQNNFSKSIEYNLKAINLYEESSDKMSALVGYDNLGNIFLKQKDAQKASMYFLKSLGLYKEFQNNSGIASTLFQLGNVEQQIGNHEKAIDFYKKSLAMSEQMKTQPIVISNLNALGTSYIELRLYDKAIQAFQRAMNVSKAINSKIELEEAYEGLANVYKFTKEREKETTFSTLSKELKDSLYNDSSLKKLTDQLLIYDSEKKQQQIELLNKEQQLKDVELLRQRQINNLFTISSSILFILFIILILFTLQNRRIAKNLRKQQVELLEKNESIMEQKEKLNQLNTVKDRFFSIISHDLRNNLTTMKLYFDLVSNKDYIQQNTNEITKQIAGSVENTIDLLENLLVWASAQIKGLPIFIQKINIHSIAEENINLLSTSSHQKNILIVNNVLEDAIAFADIDMINLVFRNLLSNAIKFTSENGMIEIRESRGNKFCTVEIKDNGIGISPENLERLFNQHEHPTTKGTANEKGTGLGLMLCKDFIERNGGKIWVESKKNKGTTFYFTLNLNRM